MKKYQNLIFVVVLIAVVAVLILVSRKKDEKSLEDDKTMQPFYTNIINKRLISGNLYPLKEIEIKSPISGILDKTYTAIGAYVKKGDKLAKVKLVPDPAQLENAKNRLKMAEIEFTLNEKEYERQKSLLDQQVISQAEFDKVANAYQQSREQMNTAQNQLTLLQEGFVQSGSISNIVEATIDGTVINLPLEEGAPVIERSTFNSGSTIAVIAQLDTFVFRSKVVESDIIALKKGLPIALTIPVQNNALLTATISKIFPLGVPENGVMKFDFEARVIIPDTLQVYSGFNATAEIIVEQKDSVLAVPEKYLLIENDSAFVMIPREKLKPEKRFVSTGISDGINIEVNKGITKDEKIILP